MSVHVTIEFKRPALVPNRRYLELLSFNPTFPAQLGGCGGGHGQDRSRGVRCKREGNDAVSQLLLQATANGQGFAEVILSMREGSACGQLHLQYTLKLVSITSFVSDGDESTGRGRVVEDFTLAFHNLWRSG
jgi:hypothetical protein